MQPVVKDQGEFVTVTAGGDADAEGVRREKGFVGIPDELEGPSGGVEIVESVSQVDAVIVEEGGRVGL